MRPDTSTHLFGSQPRRTLGAHNCWISSVPITLSSLLPRALAFASGPRLALGLFPATLLDYVHHSLASLPPNPSRYCGVGAAVADIPRIASSIKPRPLDYQYSFVLLIFWLPKPPPATTVVLTIPRLISGPPGYPEPYNGPPIVHLKGLAMLQASEHALLRQGIGGDGFLRKECVSSGMSQCGALRILYGCTHVDANTRFLCPFRAITFSSIRWRLRFNFFFFLASQPTVTLDVAYSPPHAITTPRS
ncbi:hypothetical protein B0H13DRAFT_2344827 [Mycena leptocephala]|nr:hypothetical protein B0H13DRAFT_2344827 [Mycena leptocephala]